MKSAIISKTPPKLTNTAARANFSQDSFEALVYQKGYDVLFEKALKCPCKSRRSNQLSNCKNCGGTEWIFVNPQSTRMIVHSMNATTKYKEWSEEKAGTASITCLSGDELSFMDRVTVIAGVSIFQEVLFLKDSSVGEDSISQSETVYFFNTIYEIKEITFFAIFNTSQNKLTPLIYNTDFTYEGNKIILSNSIALQYVDLEIEEQDVSVTIRYKHAPQYHIIDIPRETMQSNVKVGSLDREQIIDLPIHGIARRSHYVLDAQNYDLTRIVNNDHIFKYEDLNPPAEKC